MADTYNAGPGFQNERAQGLSYNHRDICKFDSPDDANYVTLRNALSGAIRELSRDGLFPICSKADTY